MECRLEQRTGLLTLQYSRHDVFLWGKGQVGFLPIIKDAGSLSLGLSCDTKPLCAQHPPEPLQAIVWELRGKRHRQKPAAACVRRNQVLCLQVFFTGMKTSRESRVFCQYL